MPSTLSFTQQDGIAVVTLEDPPYNRMSLEFIDELEGVVNELAAGIQPRKVS
jgi:enoyl-CoA hydratase/carnithine racemase